MVTDNELLDEVRVVLRSEVADVTAPPALLSAIRRRHARQRVTRRWVWIATPVVATAAVASIVLVPATHELPQGAPPATSTPAHGTQPVDVAYVLQHTNSALDGVRGDVIYERAPSAPGDKYFNPGERGLNERWHSADNNRFRFRATVNGSPVADLSNDTTTMVFVDYRNHTYSKRDGGMPAGYADGADDVWTPEKIQAAIRSGRIKVDGAGEPINGVATIRMTVAPIKTEVASDIWVDATTYLPVRVLWHQDGAVPFDVSWLRPTPDNLRLLTVPIPPGFKQVH